MARPRIVIAGAGVLGRLLAWTLANTGHAVQVVDPAPGPEPRQDGLGAAGFTAAGLLSPLAEAETAGFEVAALGWRSRPLWQHIGRTLAEAGHAGPDGSGLVRRAGSLLLVHPADRPSAQRVLDRLGAAPAHGLPLPRALDARELAETEPDLAPGLLAWSLKGEGQVHAPAMLAALAADAVGVRWHWGEHHAAGADEHDPLSLPHPGYAFAERIAMTGPLTSDPDQRGAPPWTATSSRSTPSC